jgi:acyl phosphate:glycerol-3-phosphate acyltransferase
MFDRIALIVLAWLAGSFPTGVVLGSFKGVDVRSIGSGNIGATNVTRAMGSRFGAYTLAGDALKGFLPVMLALWMAPDSTYYVSLIGVVCVLGHCWSIFLDFDGGKGVATSAGVFLALAPFATVMGALVWALVVLTTRVSSFGALAALPTLLLCMLIPTFDLLGMHVENPIRFLPLAVAIGLVILVRHSSNIRRMAAGMENRFGGKPE